MPSYVISVAYAITPVTILILFTPIRARRRFVQSKFQIIIIGLNKISTHFEMPWINKYWFYGNQLNLFGNVPKLRRFVGLITSNVF